MRILLFGSTGQIGRALHELLSIHGNEVIAPTRGSLDLINPNALSKTLDSAQADFIINAAAYTDVAKAEQEEVRANLVNAMAPTQMAQWCKKKSIPFVTYSTDYVFNGSGEKPYTEETFTEPLNAYGRSKLLGEKMIKDVGGDYFIFRTSWIYDEKGTNFLTKVLNQAKEKEELSIVSDQWGAPSYAKDIAEATISTFFRGLPGIYHLCNSGVTNWFQFSQQILKIARKQDLDLKVKNVRSMKSSETSPLVKRPMNSRLDCTKFEKTFGLKMRLWDRALETCMERMNENH